MPDARDRAIVADRLAAMNEIEGPRIGDFVTFADGIERRISHLWPDALNGGVQTSESGSFHLGEEGYVSFSGGLHPSVPGTTLTRTGLKRDATVWIFHHGYARADNSVTFRVPFRVYNCDREAPR